MPKPSSQIQVVPEREHWELEAEHGFHHVDSTRREVRYVNGYGMTVSIGTFGANVTRAVMAEKRRLGFDPVCDPALSEEMEGEVVQ